MDWVGLGSATFPCRNGLEDPYNILRLVGLEKTLHGDFRHAWYGYWYDCDDCYKYDCDGWYGSNYYCDDCC